MRVLGPTESCPVCPKVPTRAVLQTRLKIVAIEVFQQVSEMSGSEC